MTHDYAVFLRRLCDNLPPGKWFYDRTNPDIGVKVSIEAPVTGECKDVGWFNWDVANFLVTCVEAVPQLLEQLEIEQKLRKEAEKKLAVWTESETI